jgi:hypothetical protein
LVILSITSGLSATCRRGSDGYFRCNDGKKEVLLSDIKENYTTNPYVESRHIPQNNPYDTAYYSDPTYPKQDGTNRNMGNR